MVDITQKLIVKILAQNGTGIALNKFKTECTLFTFFTMFPSLTPLPF